MTKRLICAVALLLLSRAALAVFDASVDATSISAADTLRLMLRADGANLTGDPDLDPLTQDFEILSTQRSSQFRSINGQIDAWTTWTMLLKPRHSGVLEVPSISLRGDMSKPIQITVKDLDPQVKRAIADTVFFETSYEPKQVYVQSQVVVTRKLFYVNGAQLYGDMPNLPQIPGAMVRSLGEPEQSSTVHDGREYGLITQRFAAFPERSGKLGIPSATVTGSIRLAADSGMGGRRIGVDVSSEPLTIDVLPIPPEYPHDAAWLPAAEVELLEDWPGQPTRGLVTGTPSQRTILVRADGNAASAIPPLATALPASLKIYPEPPQLNESFTRGGIVGTRTESVSLVATQPGTLNLPQVQVTWWDTVNKQVRSATLPAHTIAATGIATTTTPQASSTPIPAESAPTLSPLADVIEAPQLPPTPSTTTLISWLAAALVAALCGWGVTAWRSRRSGLHARYTDARKAERLAHKALHRVCKGGDLQRIRAAFEEWLKLRYSAPLAESAARFNHDPAARAAVDALNARLYQRDATITYEPTELLRCVDAARTAAAKSASAADFPALYPAV